MVNMKNYEDKNMDLSEKILRFNLRTSNIPSLGWYCSSTFGKKIEIRIILVFMLSEFTSYPPTPNSDTMEGN